MAVIMFGIFGDNTFEEGPGFLRLVLAEQALAKVGSGINVLRVALQRRAVTGVGLVQLALLKIDVAELRIVMRFVDMVNLRLKFPDPFAVVRAGQFETARCRWRTAID